MRLTREKNRRRSINQIAEYFPDHGPLRRELYPKHTQYFALGLDERERCFMAANRVGKTVVGGFETTCHLTGEYPDWWEGRRFESPIDAWAAGETTETTRDIVQKELMGIGGDGGEIGTGMIPQRCIVGKPTARRGIAGAIDEVTVKHVTGGHSRLGFKSYDQGRSKFQGTAKHVIWLDEECDMKVYSECLMRTMTTQGIIMCTFTPLLGLSEVALKFMPEMRPMETE